MTNKPNDQTSAPPALRVIDDSEGSQRPAAVAPRAQLPGPVAGVALTLSGALITGLVTTYLGDGRDIAAVLHALDKTVHALALDTDTELEVVIEKVGPGVLPRDDHDRECKGHVTRAAS